MSVSTTLMTFMVRTPSSTRSVTLYGSWDNFSAPYPMSRDVRLGMEHWSGCHSFENIICDGNVSEVGVARNGALRMGGTYWYYYKLDDEIEFHNSAEPSTTRCPMLPGQLVNELHVPLTLSRSRRRDSSISSTSSERRTLNPSSKFIQPLPHPAQPKLERLNTSPTLLEPFEVNRRPPKGSVSAAPLMQADKEGSSRPAPFRVFRLPRKPSLDALLKAGSTRQNPAALRPAFQMPTTETQIDPTEKYQNIIDWIPDRQSNVGERETTNLEPSGLPERPQTKPRPGALPLRSYSDENVPLASFGEHRRQRSRSRSRNASNRNSMVFNETTHLNINNRRGVGQVPLSALIEVKTPDCTPGYGPMTGRRIALEALEGRSEDKHPLEKRLPTLPNTPSSAYPHSVSGNSPPRQNGPKVTDLGSHFSVTTIDTNWHMDSVDLGDTQLRRFLHIPSPAVQSSATKSILEKRTDGIMTGEYDGYALRPISSNPALLYELSEIEDLQHPRILSTALSCTTISSSTSTTPTSTSYAESEVTETSRLSHATSIRSSGASLNHFQHYSLPEAEINSAVTLKHFDPGNHALVNDDDKSHSTHHRSNVSHSEGMRQLLDELSYLSEMIQR